MSQFHTLIIDSIRPLTAQAVEISFQVPDDLVDNYRYEAGQFVLLRTVIAGEVVERAYSICRAPYEKKLNVAVKAVAGGVFSTYAINKLAAGDALDVSQPSGHFNCQLDSSQAGCYLFVAAGSGITPIMSIMKTVLAAEPLSQCVLLFGNKTLDSTMFADEIIALKRRYAERLKISWGFSQEADIATDTIAEVAETGRVFGGRIDTGVVENSLACIDETVKIKAFLCGPEKMTLDLRQYLLEQGFISDDVKIELFSAVPELVNDCDEVSSQAQISLTIDGEELNLVYQDATESILEHALRLDPDLPYGCQNGSCGACQVKVISGDVAMMTNYALSESEVEEGYVLLCQALPKSSKVVVSYDE